MTCSSINHKMAIVNKRFKFPVECSWNHVLQLQFWFVSFWLPCYRKKVTDLVRSIKYPSGESVLLNYIEGNYSFWGRLLGQKQQRCCVSAPGCGEQRTRKECTSYYTDVSDLMNEQHRRLRAKYLFDVVRGFSNAFSFSCRFTACKRTLRAWYVLVGKIQRSFLTRVSLLRH
jgi:hypothetical protein